MSPLDSAARRRRTRPPRDPRGNGRTQGRELAQLPRARRSTISCSHSSSARRRDRHRACRSARSLPARGVDVTAAAAGTGGVEGTRFPRLTCRRAGAPTGRDRHVRRRLSWTIGLISPSDQFIGIKQGFDAERDLAVQQLKQSPRRHPHGRRRRVDRYDNRDPSDVGNVEYALTTEAGVDVHSLRNRHDGIVTVASAHRPDPRTQTSKDRVMPTPRPSKAWSVMQRGNARFVAGQPQHPRQDVDRRAELATASPPTPCCSGAPTPGSLPRSSSTRASATSSSCGTPAK